MEWLRWFWRTDVRKVREDICSKVIGRGFDCGFLLILVPILWLGKRRPRHFHSTRVVLLCTLRQSLKLLYGLPILATFWLPNTSWITVMAREVAVKVSVR
jgi:hypothetical protein